METVTFFIALGFIYTGALLCTLVDWKGQTEDLRNLINHIFGKETHHE